MPRKVDPALIVDEAVRAEIMGRKGAWFQGHVRSSQELRRIAGTPIFPLPPFNAYQYYQNKDGSSSSGGN